MSMRRRFNTNFALTLSFAAILLAAQPASADRHGRQNFRALNVNQLSSMLFPVGSVPAFGQANIMDREDFRGKMVRSTLELSLPNSVESLGIVDDASAAAAVVTADISRGGEVINSCHLALVDEPVALKGLGKFAKFIRGLLGNRRYFELNIENGAAVTGDCSATLDGLAAGDQISMHVTSPSNEEVEIVIGQLSARKVKKFFKIGGSRR